MAGWQEVEPEDEGPFNGVDKVDGIVYAPGADSPELRAGDRQPLPPLIAPRPVPARARSRPASEWRPGGEVDRRVLARDPRDRRRSPLAAMLRAAVLVVAPLVAGVSLLLAVMDLYGMR